MLILCILMVLTGLGFALMGARLLAASQRLDARLGAVTQPRASLPLPRLLAATGRDRSEIAEKLLLAGFFDAKAPDRFATLRLAAAIVTALILLILSRFLWGDFLARPLLVLTGSGLVFIVAKQALRMLAASRARRVMAEFPFLLDLMLMMLESGISLDQCFRSIARDEGIAVPNHARMIAMLVADLDRGMRYDIALDRWAARVAVSGAKELAALFRQALFQGVELAPAVRQFIRDFTQARVTRAREAMGGITVRMVVLMILFFMPALFVVLGGPPVVAIFDTLRGVSR
ncbi:type II secretion system F family protein [Sphingobium bisphenolivorans]|uniref:type II secretion system F family protein n=1 Tax=Sphingobium bisphenolivorans TaxID=1335760 RepID=UPI0003A03A8E|nr:type II secretion system F family protein [Sphingobium bisphenolivorans]